MRKNLQIDKIWWANFPFPRKTTLIPYKKKCPILLGGLRLSRKVIIILPIKKLAKFFTNESRQLWSTIFLLLFSMTVVGQLSLTIFRDHRWPTFIDYVLVNVVN